MLTPSLFVSQINFENQLYYNLDSILSVERPSVDIEMGALKDAEETATGYHGEYTPKK